MATAGKRTRRTPRGGRKEKLRYWLMYPRALVKRPIIYELGRKHKVVTNVRQATIHDDVGLVSLELEGEHAELRKAVKWLEKIGVKVEPVEMNVIEG